MVGKTISHYKILEKLGEGGMGVVYKARDTKLKRPVALKFLPPELTRDPEAKARFVREAQAASALDHPYIGTIYEINETEDGQLFIAMACYEGETLEQKIEQGPLPIDEAIELATQVAEGLAKAHEQGIIHRDIKPANVMVTTENRVKILDFGLAKLQGRSQFTRAGTTLGTVAYMSPEQLRGEKMDHRTDIWSLGVLIYEMVTGRLPFRGDYEQAVTYSILNEEPEPMTGLRTGVPLELERIVVKAIAKGPSERYQHVDELPVDLRAITIKPSSTSRVSTTPVVATGAPPIARQRRAILWSLAGLVVGAIIAGIVVLNLTSLPPQTPRPVGRFVVILPSTEKLANLRDPAVALSPDGTYLVYAATRGGSQQLYLRALDQLESRPIPGTEGGYSPFFSPDGQWVGFFAAGKLKKVFIRGGVPLTLCDAAAPRGASWTLKETIVFSPSFSSGLLQIPAVGGSTRVLIPLDPKKREFGPTWPEVLPGGKAVFFTVSAPRGGDARQIVVQSLETGEQRVLVERGTHPRYLPTGHLLFAWEGTVLAAPFDLARLELTDVPVPLIEGVWQSFWGAAQFSFSQLGDLLYVPSGTQKGERTLVWVDRQGAAQPLTLPARDYHSPRLSPDGRQLAVAIFGADKPDVWVYNLSHQRMTRLTFETSNSAPIWTPDGKRVTFASERAGARNVFWKAADGSGAAERLTTGEHLHHPESWSRDGQVLAFLEVHPTTNRDIWVLPLSGERKPRPFLQTPFSEGATVFSPDGRWLAYVSNESGQNQIYVQPFPNPDGKWQLSSEGGTEPVWAPDGKELFYRNGEKMMAVDITTQPTFTAGKPRVLFEGGNYLVHNRPNYDVTPDGRRFVMVKESEQESGATQMVVVLNWFEELKRRVPGGKQDD